MQRAETRVVAKRAEEKNTMTSPLRASANPMKSIAHALEVLLAFSDARKPLGVTDIARQLSLHKSSVSRILTTLARAGFVDRDAQTGRYVLGLGILSLAGAVLASYQLPSAARRELELLAETTGETVTTSGWNGRQAVNLDQILGPGTIKNFSPPGRINPAHCTATGKIYLAYADDTLTSSILAEPLQRYTAKTIVDPEVLRRELQEVRRREVSLADREFIEDVAAIAAPVFNANGAVAYVIAVTMPSFRFQEQTHERTAAMVLATARGLSMRLGFRQEIAPAS